MRHIAGEQRYRFQGRNPHQTAPNQMVLDAGESSTQTDQHHLAIYEIANQRVRGLLADGFTGI